MTLYSWPCKKPIAGIESGYTARIVGGSKKRPGAKIFGGESKKVLRGSSLIDVGLSLIVGGIEFPQVRRSTVDAVVRGGKYRRIAEAGISGLRKSKTVPAMVSTESCFTAWTYETAASVDQCCSTNGLACYSGL